MSTSEMQDTGVVFCLLGPEPRVGEERLIMHVNERGHYICPFRGEGKCPPLGRTSQMPYGAIKFPKPNTGNVHRESEVRKKWREHYEKHDDREQRTGDNLPSGKVFNQHIASESWSIQCRCHVNVDFDATRRQIWFR